MYLLKSQLSEWKSYICHTVVRVYNYFICGFIATAVWMYQVVMNHDMTEDDTRCRQPSEKEEMTLPYMYYVIYLLMGF